MAKCPHLGAVLLYNKAVINNDNIVMEFENFSTTTMTPHLNFSLLSFSSFLSPIPSPPPLYSQHLSNSFLLCFCTHLMVFRATSRLSIQRSILVVLRVRWQWGTIYEGGGFVYMQYQKVNPRWLPGRQTLTCSFVSLVPFCFASFLLNFRACPAVLCE